MGLFYMVAAVETAENAQIFAVAAHHRRVRAPAHRYAVEGTPAPGTLNERGLRYRLSSHNAIAP